MLKEELTHLEVTTEECSGVVIVRLRGNAGVRETPLLEEAIRGLFAMHLSLVIVDLERLEYIAESAMELLASFRQWLIRNGGRVVLAGVSPSLRKQITKGDYGGLFPKVLDVQTALTRARR